MDVSPRTAVHDQAGAPVGGFGPVAEFGEAECLVEASCRAVDIVGLQPAAEASDLADPRFESASSQAPIAPVRITSEQVESEGRFEFGRSPAEAALQFECPRIFLFFPLPMVSVGASWD